MHEKAQQTGSEQDEKVRARVASHRMPAGPDYWPASSRPSARSTSASTSAPGPASRSQSSHRRLSVTRDDV